MFLTFKKVKKNHFYAETIVFNRSKNSEKNSKKHLRKTPTFSTFLTPKLHFSLFLDLFALTPDLLFLLLYAFSQCFTYFAYFFHFIFFQKIKRKNGQN